DQQRRPAQTGRVRRALDLEWRAQPPDRRPEDELRHRAQAGARRPDRPPRLPRRPRSDRRRPNRRSARRLARPVRRRGDHDQATRAAYASGATTSSESTRSSSPPKPGSQAPVSFTPAERFSADSSRSPQTAPSATTTASATIGSARYGAKGQTPSSAPARLPSRPSRVLAGLSRGASRV